jgi:hypothetical protein
VGKEPKLLHYANKLQKHKVIYIKHSLDMMDLVLFYEKYVAGLSFYTFFGRCQSNPGNETIRSALAIVTPTTMTKI